MPAVKANSNHHRLGYLRAAGLAFAIVAGLATFLVLPGIRGGDDGTVNAQSLLERTQRVATTAAPASGSVASYRILAEHTTEGVKADTIRTETWFMDREHVRIEERTASGQVLLGQMRSGDDFWLFGVFDGNSINASGQGVQRAVHGPADELDFTKLGIETGGSLSDLLAGLSKRGCSNAEIVGEETIAGRRAHVIVVRPKGESCTADTRFGKLGRDNVTRIWVDVETIITLRSDFYEGTRLLSSYVVREFEIDPAFAPATFTYQPSAGVQVVEVNSLGDAKKALAGVKDGEKR
jgi:hypothetical protein